jgi:glycosyltransferase involved in cell wall biosynthesis
VWPSFVPAFVRRGRWTTWRMTWPGYTGPSSPMPASEFDRCARRGQRVLFVQATEPARYPPLIHASSLMAEAGWEVTFLSAPIQGNQLELPRHSRIAVRAIPPRPSHVMGKAAYARYAVAAARLALNLRPDVVYASDPLGAAPGLLAARLACARLVYHEHDSPAPGSLRPSLARARAAAAKRAELVIFPNEARAGIAQAELGFSVDRLRIVWNLPRRAELPLLDSQPEAPLVFYYHGGISPDHLPTAVVEAVRRLRGRACLRIVGYEAPGAAGYVQRLLELGGDGKSAGFVHYAGQVSRAQLVATAAQAHVGLALITGSDVNIRHLIGASNKVFDYMAAGLGLLVSDHSAWRDMFVTPGYARACDPTDPASIAAALDWFLDHPAERQAMGASGRAKIEAEWNYDSAFAPVICTLSSERKMPGNLITPVTIWSGKE